jgi:UDP-3-O-[3-hydroxymyristoyl] glucosamine N-acyltransferase
MNFPKSYSLKEIAEILDCRYVGDPEQEVLGINEIHMVRPGDLVFVDHPKYYEKALNSAATTILIDKKVDAPVGKGLLISDDPFRDFNFLARQHTPFQKSDAAHSSSAKVGEGTIIQPNCFIGNNVTIGANCTIHSNVSIYDGCTIGDHVVIHANSIIGADAFYYKKRPDGYDRLHSSGTVLIEDRVELGAGCTIDKGVSAPTQIGAGSKLDNNVHVGHDTIIGKDCLFAAQVGIAGCVVIEDNVTLWGQVGVVSDVRIGAGAIVYGQSGVSKNIEGGKKYIGSPAEEARTKFREMASLRALPDFLERA